MGLPIFDVNSWPARRSLAAIAILLFSSSSAWAQAWPSKPVHLIVPFTAGGPTDQIARKLAEPLGTAIGQPVIVENVPGAAGAIGMARATRATADGYTLVLGASSAMTMLPHVAKLPFNVLEDFQPIGGRVSFSYVLVAHPNEPGTSAADLASRSKTIPAGLSYGSAGVGSGGHFFAELLRSRTGGHFVHVPYKGTSQAQSDLAGGQLAFIFDVVGTATPFIKAGKFKALGVSGSSRSPLLPDVPTISESVPNFEAVGWYAFFGPKGMPSDVVRKLNVEMATIYRTEDYASFFKATGYQPVEESPEALAKVVATETQLWSQVTKSAGLASEQ